ncbi:hypothetical protein P1J78_12345 [Psychromarinibacter sp. C21-152]|uniref:DUF8173 domain-containing protein n=1 Tax=Psychromarinibacter sediminicola TaxID=3033385 RepID=A0AAE3NT13_9RHOB|nr:hypothetical protein [Psychromarinibacter sediminicola]MDF0601526.1 hypothetical protein [Psychromarinibacter sediminicola]
MKRILTTLILICLSGAVAAQEEAAVFDFGGDAFRAGATVEFGTDGADDLFLAGETVRGRADIAGSAHLAGRRVEMTGAVGGDVYAAGMNVELAGAVTGDATLTGYTVRVGEVGGDLRATGSDVTVRGPVAGYALLAGDTVRIEGTVAGDVNVTARTLDFGPEASIAGVLTLYEETPGAMEIPERVIPADRVQRREKEAWQRDVGDMAPVTLWGALWRFVAGVLVVAAVAALAAAVLPESLAAMRRRILDRPLGTLWLGFLLLSALIGSAVVFALTIVGIFVSPAAIFLAVVAGFVGYVLGAYAFGVGLMLLAGRPEPATLGARALAGGLGALLAGLLALIPFLGWLFVLALTLAGVGAMTARLFRPRFFADA